MRPTATVSLSDLHSELHDKLQVAQRNVSMAALPQCRALLADITAALSDLELQTEVAFTKSQ